MWISFTLNVEEIKRCEETFRQIQEWKILILRCSNISKTINISVQFSSNILTQLKDIHFANLKELDLRNSGITSA